MIQELLGGVMEERKLSMPVGLISDGSSSPSFTSSPVSSPSMSSSQSDPQQNLRCPRCDSSNTKFCYYNNYNLTQPRHFCKTCRRYWTKGGALRNVPIGGGCRKAKPSPAAAAAARKSKPPSSDADLLSPAPIVWATPYSSQLLALLRASQFHNPNPNPNPKGAPFGAPTSIMSDPYVTLNEQSSGLDPLGQTWRTSNQYHLYQHQHQQQQQQFQQHEMMMGEAQGSGIQELLQRLRSSAGYHNTEQSPVAAVGNGLGSSASFSTATMATSTAATILEPLPLSGAEMGYWNPALPWADVSAMNGAFP